VALYPPTHLPTYPPTYLPPHLVPRYLRYRYYTVPTLPYTYRSYSTYTTSPSSPHGQRSSQPARASLPTNQRVLRQSPALNLGQSRRCDPRPTQYSINSTHTSPSRSVYSRSPSRRINVGMFHNAALILRARAPQTLLRQTIAPASRQVRLFLPAHHHRSHSFWSCGVALHMSM